MNKHVIDILRSGLGIRVAFNKGISRASSISGVKRAALWSLLFACAIGLQHMQTADAAVPSETEERFSIQTFANQSPNLQIADEIEHFDVVPNGNLNSQSDSVYGKGLNQTDATVEGIQRDTVIVDLSADETSVSHREVVENYFTADENAIVLAQSETSETDTTEVTGSIPTESNSEEASQDGDLPEKPVITISSNMGSVQPENEDLRVISITEGVDVSFTLTADRTLDSELDVIVRLEEDDTNYLNRNKETWSGVEYHAIPAGQSSYNFTVATHDNNFDDGDGLITVFIENGSGTIYDVSNNTIIIRVADNDDPPVISVRSQREVDYEGGSLLFHLISEEHSSSMDDLLVNVRIDQEGDYLEEEPSTIQVPFEYDDTSDRYVYDRFWVDTVDDDVAEPDGWVKATVVEGQGYVVSDRPEDSIYPDPIAWVRVLNNDLAPATLSLSTPKAVVKYGETTGIYISSTSSSAVIAAFTFTFVYNDGDVISFKTVRRISGNSTEPVDTPRLLREWTPEPDRPSDYEGTRWGDRSLTIEINPGENLDGTRFVRRASLNRYTIAEGGGSATVSIEAPIPTVSISSNTDSITEGETARFTLVSNVAAEGSLAVNIAVSDDGNFLTATGLVEDSVTIPSGATSVLYELDTIEDETADSNGTLTVTLLSGTGYSIDAASERATIAVLNKVVLPVLSISAVTGTITEGEVAEFALRSDIFLTTVLEMHYTATSSPNNFLQAPAPSVTGSFQIAFIAGVSTLLLQTVDDTINESDGVISVTLNPDTGTPASYKVADSPNNSASIVVLDNDEVIGLSVADAAVVENNPASGLSFVATLTEPAPEGGITFSWSTTDRTATSGQDYLSVSNEIVTFAAGESTVALTVRIHDDPLIEADETFIVTLTSQTPGVELIDSTAIGTIIDDDLVSVPGISISAADRTVAEGGVAIFTVSASEALASSLTVDVSITELHGPHDVIARTSRSITIPAEATSNSLAVAVDDDNLHDTQASIVAMVISGHGYIVGENSEATVVVVDNDDPPSISISTVTPSVEEGDTIWYLISADRASASQKTVNVTISESGSSFLDDRAPSRVEFWAYYNLVYLRVYTVDNRIDEPNGEITVQVNAGEGYTVENANSSAKASVVDNDGPAPEVSVSSVIGTLTEGGNATFQISADSAPDDALDINLRVTQVGDFILGIPPSLVRLDAVSSTAVLVVATDDDELDEVDGSVSVELLAGEGYEVAAAPDNMATVAITDNDVPLATPNLTVSAVASSIEEGTTGRFAISSDMVLQGDLDINVRVEMDGTSSVETLTMEEGESTVRLSVPTRDDELFDSEKTIVATIIEGHGYDVPATGRSASITVEDNEPTPVISVEAITASVTEGTSVWFLFRASQASVNTQTINVSVAENVGSYLEDEAPETLTIMPYYRLSIESLSTIDDEEAEGDGSITVSIEEGENYEVSENGTATVAVLDNDFGGPSPTVSATAIISTLTEGGSALFQIAASRAVSVDTTVNLNIQETGDFLKGEVPTEVVIAKNNSIGLVFVRTDDDDDDEPDGQITLEILSGTGYEVATGTDGQSSATVVDNDEMATVPYMSISALSSSVIEGSDAEFVILPSRPADEETVVKVKITKTGTFFEDGSDETIDVKVGKGETSKSFVVATSGDTVQEPDGAVIAVIEPDTGSSPDYNVDSDNSSAKVNVTDDDNHAIVTIAPVATPITEGDTAEFTVSLSATLLSNLTVNVVVRETGSMISTPVPISVVIQAGETSGTLEVDTVNDGTNEARSTITMALRNGTGYTVAASPDNSADVVVADDDPTRIEVRGRDTTDNNYQQVEGRDLLFYISTNQPYFSNVDRDLTVNIRVTETLSKLVGPLPTSAVIKAGTNQVVVRLPTVCDERPESEDPRSTVTVEILAGDGYFTERLTTANHVNTFGYKSELVVGSAGIGQQGDHQCPGDQVITVAADSASVTEGESARFTITTDIRKGDSRLIYVNVGNDTGNFIATPGRREVRLQATAKTASFSVGTVVDSDSSEDGVIFVSVAEGHASTDWSGSGFVPGTPSRATVTVRKAASSPQTGPSGALHRNVLPSLVAASVERTNSALSARVETAFTEGVGSTFELNGMSTVQDLVRYGGTLANEGGGSLQELLSDSSFALQLVPEAGGNGIATMWGSGFSRDVSDGGDDAKVSWDGEMFAGHFGMDARLGRGLLAGLSASANESSVEFENVSGFDGYEGTYGVRMTSLNPYFAWTSSDRNSLVHFSAGYGIGEVRMDLEGYDPVASESSLFTANLAGRNSLYSTESLFGGGLSELSVNGGVYSATQFVKADGDDMAGATVGVRRMNLVATASHSHVTEAGAAVSPEISVGPYWKGGNSGATSGFLMDSDITYSNQNGLELTGTASGLFTDSSGMWGLKGELAYDRGSDGIGIFTSLSPVLGESALREIQGILNDGDSDFTFDGTPNEDLAKAELEIGYGYRILDGIAVVSPYSGVSFVEGGRNSYRLGSRLEVGSDMSLELESGVESLSTGALDRKIRIDGNLEW